MSFIGRGENRVKHVLRCLFKDQAIVMSQVPIQNIINKEDFEILGSEYNQHKFDLVVVFTNGRPSIVVEVNYKHGAKSVQKWNDIFYPDIRNAGKIPLTIEDRECTSLFDTAEERPVTWGDFEDVIGALKLVRIQP
ncbi:MAG: DUF2726 domain-containing protein [Thaumarchaeota archaeon]|nr:DUF2726 domain-containing protein [Nitrososphaerota archaeon]